HRPMRMPVEKRLGASKDSICEVLSCPPRVRLNRRTLARRSGSCLLLSGGWLWFFLVSTTGNRRGWKLTSRAPLPRHAIRGPRKNSITRDRYSLRQTRPDPLHTIDADKCDRWKQKL